MRLVFGSETDHDTLKSIFGPVRGYVVRLTAAGERAMDCVLEDVAPDGTWNLVFAPTDEDGEPVGPPHAVFADDVEELYVY